MRSMIDDRPVTGLYRRRCCLRYRLCRLLFVAAQSSTTMSLTGWMKRPLDPRLFEWVSTTMG